MMQAIYMLGSPVTNSDSYYEFFYGRMLYKKDVNTGNFSRLTRDDEYIQFFSVLATGDIAVLQYNMNGYSGGEQLKLLQATTSGYSVETLSDEWVKFFALDANNTIIYAENKYNNNGSIPLYLATPRAEGGVKRVSLNMKELISPGTKNWDTPYMEDVMLDQGAVYGTFSRYIDSNDVGYDNNDVYEVFVAQILPYTGGAKLASVTFDDYNYWQYIYSTAPVVISKHTLLVETYEPAYHAEADKIVITNIATGESQDLLEFNASDSTTSRYKIKRWQMHENSVTFVGENQSNNTAVTGTITITQDATSGAYTIVKDIKSIDSSLSANKDLADMLILKATTTASVGSTGIVGEKNRYTRSIAYAHPVNPQKITNERLTVTPTGGGAAVEYLSLWTDKQHQHLIFDTTGLADSTTTPLDYATDYTIASTESYLTDGFASDTFTTRVIKGWVQNVVHGAVSDGDIASGKALSFVDSSNNGTGSYSYDYSYSAYKYGNNIGANQQNIQIEFSARTKRYGHAFNVILSAGEGNYSNNAVVRMHFGSCGITIYTRLTNDNFMRNRQSANCVRRISQWAQYRINIFMNTLKIYAGDTEIATIANFNKDKMNLAKQLLFVTQAGYNYGGDEKVQIDNLKISTLSAIDTIDTAGEVEEFEGDLPSVTELTNYSTSGM
jgi:hypothetical protein